MWLRLIRVIFRADPRERAHDGGQVFPPSADDSDAESKREASVGRVRRGAGLGGSRSRAGGSLASGL